MLYSCIFFRRIERIMPARLGDTNDTMELTTAIPPNGTSYGAEIIPVVPLLFTKTSVTIKFCILILMVIIGIPGNAFMTYVIWKTPQLRSRTNILLAWLTIADILVLLTVNLFTAI